MGAFSPFHLAIVFAIYMAPSIIALARNHPQKIAILALNFLLGWSVVGWIGALIWALISPRAAQAS